MKLLRIQNSLQLHGICEIIKAECIKERKQSVLMIKKGDVVKLN